MSDNLYKLYDILTNSIASSQPQMRAKSSTDTHTSMSPTVPELSRILNLPQAYRQTVPRSTTYASLVEP